MAFLQTAFLAKFSAKLISSVVTQKIEGANYGKLHTTPNVKI